MLTLYRSNRAEVLALRLAALLRVAPPDPFDTVAVVVNTWPTSRWLGEQLAIGLGGISANLRFPFPAPSCVSSWMPCCRTAPQPPPGPAAPIRGAPANSCGPCWSGCRS